MFYQFRYLLFLLREQLQLQRAMSYDRKLYRRASFTGLSRRKLPKGRLQGRLIATTHVIEKGLAMPEMRPRFGIGTVQSLVRLMAAYRASGPEDLDKHYAAAVRCLHDYRDRHKTLGIDVTDITGELPEAVVIPCDRPGGTFDSDSEDVFRAADAPFAAFAASRHSTRAFDTEKPVDPEIIRRAVTIALRAPSACNRQPWKVYPVLETAAIATVMQLHNGSRGFGDKLPAVLILSARMDTFGGPGERNQCYIDGGLFAMALIYALHHLQLGCVPLNWSVLPARDSQLHRLAGIPDSERVIMLLGIGHPAKTSKIPTSERRTVEEVLEEPITLSQT